LRLIVSSRQSRGGNLDETKEEKVHEAAGRIRDIMRNVLSLKVPVVVDVEIGGSWGSLEKMLNDK
jgi:DNA polymerase I-like protein with 3'-5' exonuclease and polymerase domains